MATLAEPVAHGKQVVSQLKTNTLNLFDATIIATSSVAPAYSLAATIAVLFVAVGVASPAAILVRFFPVLFIALAPLAAGIYTLQLLNSFGWISADAANSTVWQAVVGGAWLLFVTYMVVKGIRLTANFQWVLLAIEYFIVVGFCVVAFIHVIGGHAAAQPVHADWFNPLSLHNINGLAAGCALGVFFF